MSFRFIKDILTDILYGTYGNYQCVCYTVAPQEYFNFLVAVLLKSLVAPQEYFHYF